MNEIFKKSIIEFNEVKRNFEIEKVEFENQVRKFMENNGIPIRLDFFGDTFGLDIDRNIGNVFSVPSKIPLNVLTDFCSEFGCDFEYTTCGGSRWIFSFGGLNMGY